MNSHIAKALLVALLANPLGGCFRMYLKNGDVPTQAEAYPPESELNSWTNILLFGLYEESDPLNIKAKCMGKKWQYAETKLSLVHGIIGYASSGLATPRSIDYQCKAPLPSKKL